MEPAKQTPDTNSLALDRTVLANERTYAAWIRTGLAALAAGLGIARFMLDSMPLWGIRLIALPLIVFSGISFFLAAWRYEHLHVGMVPLDVKAIPVGIVKLSSYVLIGCSVLASIGLWLLQP